MKNMDLLLIKTHHLNKTNGKQFNLKKYIDYEAKSYVYAIRKTELMVRRAI